MFTECSYFIAMSCRFNLLPDCSLVFFVDSFCILWWWRVCFSSAALESSLPVCVLHGHVLHPRTVTSSLPDVGTWAACGVCGWLVRSSRWLGFSCSSLCPLSSQHWLISCVFPVNFDLLSISPMHVFQRLFVNICGWVSFQNPWMSKNTWFSHEI